MISASPKNWWTSCINRCTKQEEQEEQAEQAEQEEQAYEPIYKQEAALCWPLLLKVHYIP